MFPAPWEALPQFAAHDWPRHDGEQTLAEVALKLCRVCRIEDGDILVGASLGGMVACEIAKIRKLDALFLIGSATGNQEVSRFLTVLHPLADLAPFEWLQVSAGKFPGNVARMWVSAEASFMRSMCKAVFKWDGLGTARVPHFRIHGRRDIVIPPPQRVDLLLDGGHLISMTHAQECVEFVAAKLPG